MKKIFLSAMAMVVAVSMINAQETRPATETQPAKDTERSRPATDDAREIAPDAREARPVNAEDARMYEERANQIQEAKRQRGHEYSETFRKDFNVNDDQLQQIQVIHTETVNSYNGIDPKYFQSNEVYRTRVSEILNERDERLRTILTPEQFSRYNSNKIHYQTYDNQYFPDNLENRRSMMVPDSRIVNPDGIHQPAPTHARPAQEPGQTNPNPGGQGVQTPSETRPATSPQMQSPGQ